MTSPDPTTSVNPQRPSDPADAALFDAVAAEHAAVYGYGLVSAHSTPDLNDLVSESLAGHRELREEGIARLAARKAPAPVPAVGYRMPFDVATPTAAEKLAVRMEEDCAVAWRAVLEQAKASDDRQLAVTAMTRAAVTAAKWRSALGVVPSTVAFPGGSE
jgi:Domain of unknown function (DUF4439)